MTNLAGIESPPIGTAPVALCSLPGWLVWKLEPGRKKPRKVPYYPLSKIRRNGAQGTPEDRAQLADFETAMETCRVRGFAGVGFAPMPEWGIVGLDFDNCVRDGVVNPEVESMLFGTYAEFSPSGKGVRAFVRGPVPDIKDAHPEENAFGIETFQESGYVTVTGNILPSCRLMSSEDIVSEANPQLIQFLEERIRQKGSREGSLPDSEDARLERELALRSIDPETIEDLRDALMNGLTLAQAEDYDSWVNTGIALASIKGSKWEDEARTLWRGFSARSQATFDKEETDSKWNGFRPNRITFRSIFEDAQRNGWINPGTNRGKKLGSVEAYARLVDRTDTGNANLLVRLTEGNLRFVPERHLWLWWDGSKWIADEFGAAALAAGQKVARHYHKEAQEQRRHAEVDSLAEDERKRVSKVMEGIEKWAAHCRNKRTLEAMLALASKDARITVAAADLDRDPWLLGVANGVIDLRTGKLRNAARDEFVTKRSPVSFDPDVKAHRWNRFIKEVTGRPLPADEDPDTRAPIPETVGRYAPRLSLADYLQRALGYCLTGSVVEQKMLIALGPGSNGKNVLLDIVQEVLGDYCRTIPPEALIATRHEADAERPSSVTATLAGARLAISSESRDGQRLDVALVKRHTGGGFMTARAMRENSFRFTITHKLIMMTNYRPTLDHMDDALRGRLHLIPFDRVWNRPGHPERNVSLPDGDKELMDKLRVEAPGILTWLVQGAFLYAQEGLEPPPEVLAATRTYFNEQDPVGRWLEGYDRCDPKRGTPASELFKKYFTWHRDDDTGTGRGPETEKAFYKALLERYGVVNKRFTAGSIYGLTPKSE